MDAEHQRQQRSGCTADFRGQPAGGDSQPTRNSDSPSTRNEQEAAEGGRSVVGRCAVNSLKTILMSSITAVAFAAAACGGGGSNPNPPAISVALSSSTPTTVTAGQTAALTATVSNDSSNAGVSWSVTCNGSDCGTFNPTSTASGAATTYSAPANVPTGGSVTVVATSVADGTKTASVPITIGCQQTSAFRSQIKLLRPSRSASSPAHGGRYRRQQERRRHVEPQLQQPSVRLAEPDDNSKRRSHHVRGAGGNSCRRKRGRDCDFGVGPYQIGNGYYRDCRPSVGRRYVHLQRIRSRRKRRAVLCGRVYGSGRPHHGRRTRLPRSSKHRHGHDFASEQLRHHTA